MPASQAKDIGHAPECRLEASIAMPHRPTRCLALLLITLAPLLVPAAALERGGEPPDWSRGSILQGDGGRDYSPEALEGDLVVLYFWFTRCGPCIAAMPRLNELAAEFQDRGVQFLGVTFDDPPLVESFLEESDVGFPIVADPTWTIIRDFGVSGFPTAAFIGRDGRFLGFSSSGGVSRDLLELLLDGEPAEGTLTAIAAPRSLFGAASTDDFLLEFRLARAALPDERGMMSGGRRSARGTSIELGQAIRSLVGIQTAARMDSSLPLEEKIDFDLRVAPDAPQPLHASMGYGSGVALAAFERAFGLAIDLEEREVEVVLLSLPEDGSHKLAPADDPPIPFIEPVDEGLRLGNQLIWQALSIVEHRLGVPVEWEGPDPGHFTAILAYDPDDPESILETLQEDWGLRVERAVRPIHIVVVEEADPALIGVWGPAARTAPP